MKYEIRILDDSHGSNLEMSVLKTTDQTIAFDFLDVAIKMAKSNNDYRIGFYDEEYGYYVMAIPKGDVWEIMALADDDLGSVPRFKVRTTLQGLLDS